MDKNIAIILDQFSEAQGTAATQDLYVWESFIPAKSQDYCYGKSPSLKVGYSWEHESIEALIKPSNISVNRFEQLKEIAADLLRETKDLKPSYAKVINKHFWDLL